MNALFLLGLFWSLQEGKLGLAAFLAGLFFTHHWMTLLVFLPGFFGMAYLEREKHSAEKRSLSGWPLVSAWAPRFGWPCLFFPTGPPPELGNPLECEEFSICPPASGIPGGRGQRVPLGLDRPGQYALTGQWMEFAGLSLAALVLALPLLKKKGAPGPRAFHGLGLPLRLGLPLPASFRGQVLPDRFL